MTNSIDQFKSKIADRGGLARPNRFMVELPSIGEVSMEEMNILCRTASIPGKQTLTSDRRIGMEFEQIAYGYAVTPVTMSFLMLKDYSVKKYFDAWNSMILNEDAHTARYKTDYQRKIVIHQLEEAVPSFHLGANFQVGPFNVKAGKDINIPKIPGIMMRNSVYSIELIDAFPTTVGPVDFNNEQDGFVEFQVVFSYTNWRKNRPSAINFNMGPLGDLLNINGQMKLTDLASDFNLVGQAREFAKRQGWEIPKIKSNLGFSGSLGGFNINI